eukprot:m.3290 g.3290  ORF g.3290 m.3290 type:complete len:186 (+) comp4933_c0_seq1:214-771(+)
MTLDALQLGLALARHFTSPYLRLAFNSLQAGASVNHLHYQFWRYPRLLPLEQASFEPWRTIGSVQLLLGVEHPVHAVKLVQSSSSHEEYAAAIMAVLNLCYHQHVPFNMIIQPQHVYIVFRQPHQPLPSINIGFPEVSGQLLVLDADVYHHTTAEEVRQHWQQHVRLQANVWLTLKRALSTIRLV